MRLKKYLKLNKKKFGSGKFTTVKKIPGHRNLRKDTLIKNASDIKN